MKGKDGRNKSHYKSTENYLIQMQQHFSSIIT